MKENNRIVKNDCKKEIFDSFIKRLKNISQLTLKSYKPASEKVWQERYSFACQYDHISVVYETNSRTLVITGEEVLIKLLDGEFELAEWETGGHGTNAIGNDSFKCIEKAKIKNQDNARDKNRITDKSEIKDKNEISNRTEVKKGNEFLDNNEINTNNETKDKRILTQIKIEAFSRKNPIEKQKNDITINQNDKSNSQKSVIQNNKKESQKIWSDKENKPAIGKQGISKESIANKTDISKLAIEKHGISKGSVENKSAISKPIVEKHGISKETIENKSVISKAIVEKQEISKESIENKTAISKLSIEKQGISKGSVENKSTISKPIVEKQGISKDIIENKNGISKPLVEKQGISKDIIENKNGISKPLVEKRGISKNSIENKTAISKPAVEKQGISKESIENKMAISKTAIDNKNAETFKPLINDKNVVEEDKNAASEPAKQLDDLYKNGFVIKKFEFEKFETALKKIKEINGATCRQTANAEGSRTYIIEDSKNKVYMRYVPTTKTLQLQGRRSKLFGEVQVLVSQNSDYVTAVSSHIELTGEEKRARDMERRLKKLLPASFDFLSEQSRIDLTIGMMDIGNEDVKLSDYSMLLVPPYRGLERLIFDLQRARGIEVKMIGQAFEKQDGSYVLKLGYRRKSGSIIFAEVMSALYSEYFAKRNFYAHSDITGDLLSRVITEKSAVKDIFAGLIQIIEYNISKLKETNFKLKNEN